jgi:bifunctional ADP-heptose synthase (sugar kinase/adenylyltransferase)
MLLGGTPPASLAETKAAAVELARRSGRDVFVTLAEEGLMGASQGGEAVHFPALPVRGEIDIVGAGDSVTANLTTALAAGAALDEALELAGAASSVVIHQLGTTGTATIRQITEALKAAGRLDGE